MADNTLKAGFIGAGGMARAHMESVSNLEDVQITGICDLDSKRAAEATAEFGGTAYTEFREMLDAGVDALYIVTPPFAHGDIEADVIERGIPFLVEKPVALDLDTALRTRDAVEAKGLITSAGYQLRYLPGIQQAKEFFGGIPLGMVCGHYWSSMISGGWWPIREKSGGQLVEQATHIVDLMRDFAGDIVEVDARMEQRGEWDAHVDIPDVYTVRFGFKSGAIGQLTTTCMTADWHVGIDIIFQGGRANWTPDTLTVTPHTIIVPELEKFPARNIDEVFLNAVRTGDPSAIRSDYADAVRTLAVSLAANESAEKGASVKPGV